MRIEDAVNALNQYITKVRKERDLSVNSFLVVRRWVSQAETGFKAYKTAHVEINLVGTDKPQRVITVNYTGRIVSTEEEIVVKHIEMTALTKIYEIIQTDIFNQLVEGTYESIIPDK